MALSVGGRVPSPFSAPRQGAEKPMTPIMNATNAGSRKCPEYPTESIIVPPQSGATKGPFVPPQRSAPFGHRPILNAFSNDNWIRYQITTKGKSIRIPIPNRKLDPAS